MTTRASCSLLAAIACVGCAPILGIEDTVFEEPIDECALVPQRVFFADKVTENVALTLGMVTDAQLHGMATSLNTVIDPDRAHVLAAVTDCDAALLEDAELDYEDPPTGHVPFTLDEVGPTLGEDTSEIGLVGALNVNAPAELKLYARPSETMGQVSSIGDVDTMRGEIAFITLRPNSEAPPPDPIPMGFSCIGVAPMATVTTITITLTVRASSNFAPTGQPLPGVRARYCEEDEGACSLALEQPLDLSKENETNANGVAALTIEIPTEGFDGSIIVGGRLPGCP